MMNGATTFISRILNDVLCVHEIEEGALKILKKPFHIEAIIRDAMDSTQQSAVSKHCQVTFGDTENDSSTIDSTSPLLMGDQQKLLEVLTSFIENAIRRSDPLTNVTITLTKKFNDVIFPCSRLHKVMNIMSLSSTQSDRTIHVESPPLSPAPATKSLPTITLPHGASYFQSKVRNYSGRNDRSVRRRNNGLAEDITAGMSSNPLGYRESGSLFCHSKSISELRPFNSSLNCTSRSCNVEVCVIDRGDRVSEDDLQVLIQPYRQIRPDLSDEGRGTGLWLVLAQEIIALHGGSILFDSSSEDGNIFGFRIPFIIATSTEQKNADMLRIVNTTSNQLKEAERESCHSSASILIESAKKYLVVDGKKLNSTILFLLFLNDVVILRLLFCIFFSCFDVPFSLFLHMKMHLH